MPQDLFDCCALTVAMAGFMEKDMMEFSQDFAQDYSQAYNDSDQAKQMFAAGEMLVKGIPILMQGDYTNLQLAGACKTLQKAIMKFNPDGSKKRRGLLGGTRFKFEKSEILNKSERCIANVTLYHLAMVDGAINPLKLK